jgi:hypothetical protein
MSEFVSETTVTRCAQDANRISEANVSGLNGKKYSTDGELVARSWRQL